MEKSEKEIKDSKKYRFYGKMIYYVVKILEKTITHKEIYPNGFNKDEPYVTVFWHNKLVFTFLGAKFMKKRVGLASPSKDGELVSVPLEMNGVYVVRGSSDKESVRSLIEVIKKTRDGYCVGTPVDGPKGPIYKVKPGMIYVAQKAKRKILPVGVAYKNKYVFEKAWDKFQLPYPFTKSIAVYGEPYYISEDSDVEMEMEKLKLKIDELDKKAQEEIEKI